MKEQVVILLTVCDSVISSKAFYTACDLHYLLRCLHGKR